MKSIGAMSKNKGVLFVAVIIAVALVGMVAFCFSSESEKVYDDIITEQENDTFTVAGSGAAVYVGERR